MIVRELVTKLGFTFDPSGLNKAETAIAGIQHSLINVGAAAGLTGQNLINVGAAATGMSAGIDKAGESLAKTSVEAKKLDADTAALKGKLESIVSLLTAGALAAGITHLVHGAVELGSRLNDTAEQFGISTDALQKFQYAAGLAGVRAAQFNAAMSPLSRQIFAAGEGTKEATALFHKFKIAFKDSKGQLLPTEDVIGNIADRIQTMKSPAEQAGLAMKFFGRAGAKLVPILRNGRKGLAAMGLELDRLGGPLSEESIKALDDLGDSADRVHTAFGNFKAEIAMALVPALTWITEKIGGMIGGFREIAKHSKIVEVAFIALGSVMAFFGARALLSLAPILLPIMGIAAGITALIFLYDELWVTLQGGDTYLNDFVKWCTDSKIQAEGLLGVIKEIGNTIFTLGDKVYEFLHPGEAKQGVPGQNGGPVQTKMIDLTGMFKKGEDGKTYQRRTEEVGPLGLFGTRQFYTPADTPTAGNRGQSFTQENTINITSAQGSDPEAIKTHVEEALNAHSRRMIKEARAATLPSVAR